MSLATTTNKIVYTGSGITGPYSFPFPIYASTNLVVTKYTIADGTETVFVLNTDYTVAGSFTSTNPASGSITLTSTLSSSYKLIIQRVLTFDQPVDLQPNDDLPADTIEKSMADRIVMLVQQVKEIAERAVVQDLTNSSTIVLPVPSDGSVIGWDSNGELVNVTPNSDTYLTKASQAEAEAGTENTTYTTPLRVKQAIDALSPVTLTNTVTLTNKRVTQRVVTTTSDATAVIDVAVTDVYELSAMAAATEFSLTGTPTDGQKIIIRFKDNAVTRALTWTGITAIGVTLPTTTTVSKWHYVGIMYNSAATQWQAIAYSVEV